MKCKYIIIGFIFLLSFGLAIATPMKISQFQVNVTNTYNVNFSMKNKPDYTYFSLKNPNRFVIDFKNAEQDFTASTSIFTGFPIQDMRIAKKSHHGLRLVFDLHMANTVKVHLKKTTNVYPYQVTLSFTPLTHSKDLLPLNSGTTSHVKKN
jgi:hypothetical protein